MRDGNGNLILDTENKVRKWKQYIEKLYLGDDGLTDVQNSGNMDEQGETILKDEFNKVLKEKRRNKAPGVDHIPIELIQNSGETVNEELLKLVKEIYELEIIYEDFQKSFIIQTPKKQPQINVTTSVH